MVKKTAPRATGDSRALKTFAKLDKEKRVLEDRLEKVKASLKETEPKVIEYFERMGMDRASIDGVTVYIKRDLWAGKVEDADAVTVKAAFDAAGLDEYCQPRLNHQSFSAYVRELEKQNLPEGSNSGSLLPEEIVKLLPIQLQSIVKISETFKIGTRKSQ